MTPTRLSLHWYRAAPGSDSGLLGANVPIVDVPTLYLWGDRDATVGSFAAEATRDFVSADFRFEVIAGSGHFLTDQSAAPVTAALLQHIRRNSPPD